MSLLELIQNAATPQQLRKFIPQIGQPQLGLNEVVTIYLNGPMRITQRATVLLIYFANNHPKLIDKELGQIITYLQKPKASVAVKRNTVRFLQFMPISKKWQGRVADICFRYLTSHTEPIAVKVFAMTVLANLAMENQELKNELIPIIEDQLPFGSAGFRNRGARIMKQLKG